MIDDLRLPIDEVKSKIENQNSKISLGQVYASAGDSLLRTRAGIDELECFFDENLPGHFA